LSARWQNDLDRWLDNGVIDRVTADRIRAFEEKLAATKGLGWPVLIAMAFGGLLLGAGVLLFVAAHWDMLPPAARFALVLALVAVFHIAAAFTAQHLAVLATTFHAVGTISLGAGIFLAGQIFNLQEHWPGGLLLWAMGAWLGLALLRDWPQAALVALLTPAWLAGEWIEATRRLIGFEKPMTEGLLLLSITYLTARTPDNESSIRKSLTWIGALGLFPLAAWVGIEPTSSYQTTSMPTPYWTLGWLIALCMPLIVAWYLRRQASKWNFLAALWVVVLGTMGGSAVAAHSSLADFWRELGPYLMWSVGAVGLTAWGVHEAHKERINLGIAGFALTVVAFYFSTVMDKLGRSASLIGMGVLFLVGGWILERMRRLLVARLEQKNS